MSNQLIHSMFHEVFFPDSASQGINQAELTLNKVLRYQPSHQLAFSRFETVVFDFETTGLDSRNDRIIEIGAIRYRDCEAVAEFSQLINPQRALSEIVKKLTGIDDEMLADQPVIEDVLGNFLQFIEGGILCAHNAEFDMGFLSNTCLRQGYQIQWPCFCTLKMARQLLPDLESRNLDTLADHFGLTFESRHRSIGDCKVTAAVLRAMVDQDSDRLMTWQDFQPFSVGLKNI